MEDNHFIQKVKLKERYAVFGSFYNVILKDGTIISCRSDLHIVDKEYLKTSGVNGKPQLLVIMMNPGNSSPLDMNYKIPVYERIKAPDLIRRTPFVPASDDDTQNQLMRIMWNTDINHVRIINISDIRNTDSNDFGSKLLGIHSIDKIHSIFCEERKQEHEQLFNGLGNNAVILKAWGKAIVDSCPSFKDILENYCLPSLPTGIKQIGLQGKTYLHYSHPLPKSNFNSQKQWVKEASSLLLNIC
ncbi:hypothetical protein E2R55_03070 [Vibrio vulnificus]|nr:hypothetical protein E2R55_03070 [Vibrio vulnificus]